MKQEQYPREFMFYIFVKPFIVLYKMIRSIILKEKQGRYNNEDTKDRQTR